jgi:hypothetical protein
VSVGVSVSVSVCCVRGGGKGGGVGWGQVQQHDHPGAATVFCASILPELPSECVDAWVWVWVWVVACTLIYRGPTDLKHMCALILSHDALNTRLRS